MQICIKIIVCYIEQGGGEEGRERKTPNFTFFKPSIPTSCDPLFISPALRSEPCHNQMLIQALFFGAHFYEKIIIIKKYQF